MTPPLSGDLECWRPPQSPFQIFYSRLVLEQIRLAVVDAYFLVPRGGLEIGGVLLGRSRDREIEVLDHEPLHCEHAFGPSFSLSPRDQERLKDLLAKVHHRPGGLEPVGWYHSHTRGEIYLTQSDLDIHNRYFPEIRQVALVLRPSTSQPVKAGFFFRETGGSIRASASYHEFRLEPMRSGPALLKTEGDVRARQSSGDSRAADPVIALPSPESRPQPIERVPRPAQERAAATTASARPALEPAPAPGANSKPPRERPAPLTAERPIPRGQPLKPDAEPAGRFLLPAADARPPLEHTVRNLTPGGPPKPPRERPVPLTRNEEPAPERQQPPFEYSRPASDVAPMRVVRRVVDPLPVAAPDPQPKAELQGTSTFETAPRLNAPAAMRSSPEPALPSGPAKRLGSEVELPRFLRNEPPPQAEWTRIPLFIVAMLFLVVALGGLVFVARDAMLPSLRAVARRVSTPRTASPSARIGPAMSISAIDDLGQLQIRWDTASRSVRAGRSGVLSIVDGGPPQRIPLDGPQLQAGAFIYKRHGARVDARLTVVTAEGSSVDAATTFLGPPVVQEAEPAVSTGSAAALAKENTQLRQQLDEQITRNKTLQAQLDRLRKQRAKKTGQ
jgi:proteasome lid subunit RPN8/RPN11